MRNDFDSSTGQNRWGLSPLTWNSITSQPGLALREILVRVRAIYANVYDRDVLHKKQYDSKVIRKA